MEVAGARPLTEREHAYRQQADRLANVVRDLLAHDPQNTQRILNARGIPDLAAFVGENAELGVSVPEAILDPDPHGGSVYRCSQCGWELERGSCRFCGLDFDVDVEHDGDYTSNEAYNPDRVTQPRGTTPVQEFEARAHEVPAAYAARREEYEELRGRGATRLMCETFHLEFRADAGIVAWADGAIFDEFSGALMQRGDFWKIMLGRRVELEDDDEDGSFFMEALLEDAMLFPTYSGCKWDTAEESPGIWVTRARGIVPQTSPAPSDDFFDDYDNAAGLENAQLEPGYVPPAQAIHARDYAASDAESESDADGGDELTMGEQDEDSDGAVDPGWTIDARIPDVGWVPEGETTDFPQDGSETDELEMDVELEGEANVDAEASNNDIHVEAGAEEQLNGDSDSADSDFDDEEVLSGDEYVLAGGR